MQIFELCILSIGFVNYFQLDGRSRLDNTGMLVVEEGRLSVHFLYSNPSMADHDMALVVEAPSDLWLGVDDVAELDLLLAKLLLVLLQPGLVVLDEQVDGVAL